MTFKELILFSPWRVLNARRNSAHVIILDILENETEDNNMQMYILWTHQCRWSPSVWWREVDFGFSLSPAPSLLSACWWCCIVYWGRSLSSGAGLCELQRLESVGPCPRWTWSQTWWTRSLTRLCLRDRGADSGRIWGRSWRWKRYSCRPLQVEKFPLPAASVSRPDKEHFDWLVPPFLRPQHIRPS